MASFKSKINQKKAVPFKKEASTEGPREYFPKQMGIYTEENPNANRREVRPLVIATPPTNRQGNITFKDRNFTGVSSWIGRLLADPILIDIGYYPVDALYKGTDQRIIPNTKFTYDKPIPILTEETGIECPLKYDLISSVEKERERLSAELLKAKSEKAQKYLTDKLEQIKDEDDTGLIVSTHEVRTVTNVFIPILTMVVEEIEDPDTGEFTKAYYPYVAILRETLGGKKIKGLHKSEVIETPMVGDALEYLFGEAEGLEKGAIVQVFNNKLACIDSSTPPALTLKKIEGDIPKPLQPYVKFNLADYEKLDEDTLLRLIVLEIIQLYAPKDDRESLEGKLKDYFWSKILKNEV